MKRLIYFLFFLAPLFLAAQSPFYHDVVRSNTLSPARVANALDVSKPLASSGTDTYTFSAPFTGFSYHTGDIYTLVFANANTSATVTANIGALGALAIKDASGTDLGIGDLKAGGAYKFYHNGTHLRMIGAAGGAGAVASVFSRTGAVVAATSDYDAVQVDNTPAGGIAATNAQAAINELDTEKANLASPTFTGTPAAPTATYGTNTTQVATTALIISSRVFGSAVTDEVTPVDVGSSLITFHMPYDIPTIQEIFIEIGTAQASGSIFTVDVNKNGSTILSTKLTIDNTEETSLTAAVAAVLSSTTIAKGDKITIDVDQVGDGTAIGLKIWIRG